MAKDNFYTHSGIFHRPTADQVALIGCLPPKLPSIHPGLLGEQSRL